MRRITFLSLHVEDSPEAVPLGAASVAAALRGAGFEPVILEGLASEPAGALAARILASNTEAVGLSVYSWNRLRAAEVAALLRSRSPCLLLFAGGPEATADPEGLLAAAPLDFLVRGEGETATRLALEAIAAAGPGSSADHDAAAGAEPGCADRPGGARALSAAAEAALAAIAGIALPGRAAASRRAPPEDLSGLPSPWLAGLVDPRRRGGALWELARGCPFHCAYCYEGKGESGVRRFPRGRVEAELGIFAAAARSGGETLQVFVLDPTFNADRARARELLALFGKRGGGIHWKFEARAEFIDRDLARRFADLDCSLQIGLQSAVPEVSGRVGRRLDPADFSRRIGYLNEAGAVFGLDLIYGLPGDDPAGFARSVDFALGLLPNHLDIFPLAVLPGTELADRAEEYGLSHSREPPYLVASTPGFPPEAMARASRLAAACDLFYSRGRAVSWFLQALRPLKARPSAFLSRFAESLAANGPDGAAGAAGPLGVEALQLAFLEGEYRAKELERLLPALRDVVRFNGAWGRALAEGERTELELSYDPDEVLGPAALDLAAFARAARPSPARVAVLPAPGGARLERLKPRRR